MVSVHNTSLQVEVSAEKGAELMLPDRACDSTSSGQWPTWRPGGSTGQGFGSAQGER